ncbi:hypothetical protein ACFSBI_05230, partial [Amnibacterium endophyticum]
GGGGGAPQARPRSGADPRRGGPERAGAAPGVGDDIAQGGGADAGRIADALEAVAAGIRS